MEVLCNNGYLSMALTLQRLSQADTLTFSTATIFAPSHSAFIQSGQPSLSILQYYVSPIRLSIQDLKTLPYGTKIPTLQSQKSLFVTSPNSDSELSINNVNINKSAIFVDGSVIIYGMHQFFNSPLVISQILAPARSPTRSIAHRPSVKEPSDFGTDPFARVSDKLSSRGYSKMATFLDVQLAGFSDETRLTKDSPSVLLIRVMSLCLMAFQ